jgi:hypothetical protein
METEPPPEDPLLWLTLELCVLSDELVECEKLGLSCELEMLVELVLEERSGVGAGGGELWMAPAPPSPGWEGVCEECCAKIPKGTTRRPAAMK